MKKILACVLALSMIFSSVSVLEESTFTQQTSITASAQTSGNYNYEVLSDGAVKITGYSGSASKLTIPEKLGGKTVSCISSEAFSGNRTLKSVLIPKSVKQILDHAFYGCTLLESVTFSNGLEYIGSSAFAKCTALKSVTLPSTLKSAGSGVFQNCTALESANLTKSLKVLPDSMFAHCSSLKYAGIVNGVTTIGNKAFAYCRSLNSIYISSTVKTIGDSAFENCASLTAVKIPANVSIIGSSAFWNCTKLSSVTLPQSLSKLGTYAFGATDWLISMRKKNPVVVVGSTLIDAKNYSKQNMTVPSSVRYIADGAFSMNTSIKKVVLPAGVKRIGDYAFYSCGELSQITLPQGLKSIGECAMYGCESLSAITLPDSAASVGSYAFSKCSSLRKAVLGNGLVKLSDHLFENCASLLSVKIGNSTKAIGNDTFAGCTSLKSAALPDTLAKIGSKAFLNCSKLSFSSLPSKLESIETKAFYGCTNISKILVASSVKNIGSMALGYYGSDKKKLTSLRIVCNKDTAAYKYAKSNGFLITELPSYERINGSNRYSTSIEISKKSYPNGTQTVVIASGDNYADALVGVPLASSLGAPILLCSKNVITEQTLAEIKRLGAKNVIILGGTGAVSKKVEDKIKAVTSSVERIEGSSRFETSAKAAEKLGKTGSIFFVFYNGFADALSASSIAAVRSAPIVYVQKDGKLDESVSSYIQSVKKNIKNAYIIGGEGVISSKMKKTIESALGKKTTRLSGSNRYDTCAAVNSHFRKELKSDSICIATGTDFPDALAGGVFAAKNRSALMIADNTLSGKQTSLLHSVSPKKIYAIGGSAAVPNKIIDLIAVNSVK